MASTPIALGWNICLVLLTAWSGVSADPAVSLVCPPVFRNGIDNVIRYEVDSAAIASKCFFASNVVFNIVLKGQTSATTLCSAPYPPSSCSDFTTSGVCGCVQQEGTTDIVYTYQYTFPVDDSHVGGRLEAQLCVGATAPIEEFRSRSCDSVSFGVSADPAVSLVCPPVFRNGTDNVIRYEVDSAAIASAGCVAATNVVFIFVLKGQTSALTLCSAPYPPSSCVDFTTSNNCGCVQQEGTTDIVYTYKYTFPVDDSHVGGRLEGQLCVLASTPIEQFKSRSCDSISFGGL